MKYTWAFPLGKKIPFFPFYFAFSFFFFGGGGIDDVFAVVTQFQSITAVADQSTYFVAEQALHDYESPLDLQEGRHCNENQNDFLILTIMKNSHIPTNFTQNFS